MSENNVENTSFKIDDVSEEKSQFEIDNERRAQLEREQEQESVEQVDDMQENQDEEQESQEEQVQEQEQEQEQVQEQAPIHISHETQIVDNFFDGPPPVRKTANQNQQTQNTNAQTENIQKSDNQQQNLENNNVNAQNQVQGQNKATVQNVQNQTENNVEKQVQNTATVQNVQNNEQQNHSNVAENKVANSEVKVETKPEPPKPLPPIKPPKHNTVIVDNNLDMPRKKATSPTTNGSNTNTNQNAQSSHNSQNVQTQVENQTQNPAQNTTTVQNVQNNFNSQQNNASVTNNQPLNHEVKAETKVEPAPIKLPKHETVIVDNNLDVATSKKNKKNKKAGKNADTNKNAAKKPEVKTVQQTSPNADKIVENKEQIQENAKNVEQTVTNKEVKAKNENAETKHNEKNVQNNTKSQELTAKVAVETPSVQTENSKLDEINKKVNSIPENDISSNVRRPQMVSQGTSDIISLITPDIYAGFGIRCVAFVVDALFVIGLMNIALYFGIESYIPISIGIVYMILFAFYSFIFVYIFDGQTIGKMVMGIKVVEDNGNKLALFTAFVREFAGKLIMIPLFILFIFTAFSYKKHSLMDYLSDTSVIKCKFQPLFDELRSEMD
mgnify:CR=1 FL=1